MGEFPGGSCWCEVSMLLNDVENPGIYVVTDTEEVYCFDHISCCILKANNDMLVLEVSNNTAYGADVTLLAETSAQKKHPLGANPWERFQHIHIENHEKARVSLKK